MTAVNSVLVVGATGQVGRQVVAEAQREGITPIAASRNPQRASSALGVDAVAFGAADSAGIKNALATVDAVVMTHGGDSHPEDFFTTAAAVIDAAQELGKPVALMTSMGVSHRPSGPYASLMGAKHRAEVYLRAADLHYIIVRPGWFGYDRPGDDALDIRQGDKVTGQPGVNTRHIAQTLLHDLTDTEGNYTLELFSQPGQATTTPEQWRAQFDALTPDVRGAQSGPLD